VAEGTAIVSYGHERPVTEALSAACDLRVVWGGDATVRAIREVALPPRARELAFPNRFSLAAFDVAAYGALDGGGRDALAERFYNDTFWFDQMGCSSPRVLVWVGARDGAERCAADFHPRVLAVTAAKAYAPETGAVLGKLTYGYRAAMDGTAVRVEAPGNALTVVTLGGLGDLARGRTREHPGGGLLLQAAAPALADLTAVVTGADQTLAHFGFAPAALRGLALALAGRGIDRMVPVGRALNFGRVWDGVDLLQEMTRRVVIEAEPAGTGARA
jgi:hypothetical protein